jgi:hypothetical protein
MLRKPAVLFGDEIFEFERDRRRFDPRAHVVARRFERAHVAFVQAPQAGRDVLVEPALREELPEGVRRDRKARRDAHARIDQLAERRNFAADELQRLAPAILEQTDERRAVGHLLTFPPESEDRIASKPRAKGRAEEHAMLDEFE